MIQRSLGRLQQVDLRAVWRNEAGDFTPWLAQPDNLALLGETIGLELELDSQERWVGPFRADIVCKDTLNDSWVLVENQLERTDHSHLGQLLTYAAGLKAVTIVWIADRFTDEHRAALDWLNEVTDEEINFFGLEVELWRIGDSPLAPKFNVVSKPNNWTKIVSTSRRQPDDLTNVQQLYLEFWQGLVEYFDTHKSFLKARKPRPGYGLAFAIGRSKFRLEALIYAVYGQHIGTQLIVSGENAKAHFHSLYRDREAIEAEIGERLEWNEQPDTKRSSIALKNSFLDPNPAKPEPNRV